MWFAKNVLQGCDGAVSRSGRYRDTVRSETVMPSFRNSPWIRGAPQRKFAAAMRRMRVRTCESMRCCAHVNDFLPGRDIGEGHVLRKRLLLHGIEPTPAALGGSGHDNGIALRHYIRNGCIEWPESEAHTTCCR